MNIYVGNLPFDATADEIHQLFSAYGTVADVQIIHDRFTKRSRGFGFVEMEDDRETDAAIAALNGKELRGRKLLVNKARPREPGGSRGGFVQRQKQWSK
jgi:RNA recognition motif-containing protein